MSLNKHLPSDIDKLTRKELAEIYLIHVEEYQKLNAQLASAKADGIREATYKTRTHMVEGGTNWFCRVDDLLNHADELESSANENF
jgi:hypothetical protein